MEATISLVGSVSLSYADDERIIVGEGVVNEEVQERLLELLRNYEESQDEVELVVRAEVETEDEAMHREAHRTVQVESLLTGEESQEGSEVSEDRRFDMKLVGRIARYEDMEDWLLENKPVIKTIMDCLHGLLDRYDGSLVPVTLSVNFVLTVLTKTQEDTLVTE